MSTKRKGTPAPGRSFTGNTPQVQQLLAQAMALLQRGQLAQAGALYQHILQIQPANFDALHLLGVIATQGGNPAAAVDLLDKAVAVNPRSADAYYNRGNALRHLGQYEAARIDYDQAVSLNPRHADAYFNRGIVLRNLEQYEEALQSYDKSIALAPGHADVHYNRGNVLQKLKRLPAALEDYNHAIAIQPRYAEAYYNRGTVLEDLRQPQAALEDYNRAIALKPDYAEAYCNRGNALQSLRQYQASLADYDKAIALKPDFVIAHNNKGNALVDLKQPRAALECYDRAVALKPDYEFLYGTRLYTKLNICEWEGVEDQCRQVEAATERGEMVVGPFAALAMTDSPTAQKRIAEIVVHNKYPPNYSLPLLRKHPRHDRIRIAYVSADFRYHAVSLLMAELLERHDKSRFELTALSLEPDTGDAVRKRVAAAFDRFVDVHDKTDADIALLARKLEIDIAVDLGGFTRNNRPGIFALRAAPVQVNYLGYSGTMGAEYMDYLIADPVVIPESARQFYTEKIAYLPCYMPADTQRRVSERQYTREELGLPPTGFIFCSFNNSYKLNPATFDSWMRILHRVEGSVLWLSRGSPEVADNLKREAGHRGIAADRIIFAGFMESQEEHLARLRVADLFLDALPYNAHTTACDALWAGLPLLTLPGQTFAARVAASLLSATGLPELITASREEYEDRAVELASHPARMAQLREKLARNLPTAALFDTQSFTRHIEAAYVEMYERCQADLPPEHIRTEA